MQDIGALALIFVVSTLASGGLIWLLQPLWRHYALARPNSRSSHTVPTPQGGGIVIIAVTIIVAASTLALIPAIGGAPPHIAFVFAAAIFLAIVGAVDDVHAVEVVPRLLLQTLAVIIVIATLPSELRVLPELSWWLERLLLVVGGVWFVNLVNFMDGIDWITVGEVVPVTAGLALFGLIGALPPHATVVSFALCGAMIGFAPYNRPVARLFLGDVGSLPLGLLLGWLLTLLAGSGHLAAAILLPLYYLADTTITLLRRLARREMIAQAHRSHYYQRAMDGGFTVYQIVRSVFAVNIVLVALATLTVLRASFALHIAALAVGAALVGTLLWTFDRAYRSG